MSGCGVDSEEEHEADDTGAVVEQGFGIDQGGKAFTGLQLVKQGYHGYGVGGTDQGSEHESKGPRPLLVTGHYVTDAYQQQGGKHHADDQSGNGQQGCIGKGLLEDVKIEFVGCIENEYGQKDVEDKVGVDVGYTDQGFFQAGNGVEQTVTVGQTD